jgi:4-amino-4-deoxy-L-arabinose transferase-like glycosyltransferase
MNIMKKNRITLYFLITFIVIGVMIQCVVLFFVIDPNALTWWDSEGYYSIAKELTAGAPYSTVEKSNNLYFSPGYPFILSLMMRIVGTQVVHIRLFHIALFPIFLLTLYRLGALLKGKSVGLISVLFAVVYPYYLYQPLALYPESFLIYLFPGMLILMFLLREKMRYPLLILLSGLIALAVMIRPVLVYLVPFAWFIIIRRNGFPIKRVIVVGIIITLIPLLTVCGWMVRNKVIHGSFIFAQSGAYTLLLNYNENADWRIKKAPFPEEIQERLRAAKDNFEKQQIYKEEAIGFIKRHPVKSLAIAVMQCIDLWNPIPRTTIEQGFAQSKYKILAAIPYLFFLIAGIFGMVKERKFLFFQFFVVLMVLNTVFNGIIAISIRYRLVTDFAFIIMAACAIKTGLKKIPVRFLMR